MAADKADGADVEHVGQALQRHDRVDPLGLDRLGALEELLLAIEVQRRDAGRGGERVAGVGVAVEELDGVLGPVHEGVVDALAGDHAAHRHGAGVHAPWRSRSCPGSTP